MSDAAANEILLTVRSHLLAALAMLGEAIEACPDDLWTSSTGGAPYWQIAYHAAFYADFYLSDNFGAFDGPTLVCPGHDLRDRPAEAPSRRAVAQYVQTIADKCRDYVARLQPDDLLQDGGFRLTTTSVLDKLLYNTRHVQHHTGQLFAALVRRQTPRPEWVARM